MEIFLDENGREYTLGEEEDFDPNNPNHQNKENYVISKNGNVFIHTMLVLKHARSFTDNLLSLWGALLHDIGKPDTKKINEKGNISNHGHETVGADIARNILNRLKFSSDDTKIIVACVKDHMKVYTFDEMKTATKRKLIREPHFPFLIPIFKGDNLGSIPIDRTAGVDKTATIKEIEKMMKEDTEEIVPIINGHDLIAVGIKPSPMFAGILRELLDLQLEGKIRTREEGMEALVKVLKNGNSEI